MSARVTPEVLQALDAELYSCISGIDILSAVVPLNYRQERERFFASNCSVNPAFQYTEHTVDLLEKKRSLYNFPVEKLGDELLVRLYSDVIESYADKVDQFKSIGSSDFLYDSLRYYGEPTKKDLSNARFVLHLPDDMDPGEETLVDAAAMVKYLEAFAIHEGYEYQVVLDDGMIANALVSGTKVKVNSSARVTMVELNALAHHELGVHLVTTLNGRAQPLRILSLGSPLNTTTQEGLAILAEYLSGSLTLNRLKVLALRVIAVQSLLLDKEFKRTFALLKEGYKVADDLAFTITARVYRGGGLTKDYLYLQGFHQMLNAYEQEPNFTHLLSGKVSLGHLPLVTQLIEREILLPPSLISPAFVAPSEVDTVKRFIAHAIK